jgi:hypothetical protein
MKWDAGFDWCQVLCVVQVSRLVWQDHMIRSLTLLCTVAEEEVCLLSLTTVFLSKVPHVIILFRSTGNMMCQ